MEEKVYLLSTILFQFISFINALIDDQQIEKSNILHNEAMEDIKKESENEVFYV